MDIFHHFPFGKPIDVYYTADILENCDYDSVG